MKCPLKTLLSVLVLISAAGQAPAQVVRDITLKVRDDQGSILAGAEALIGFERVGGQDRNQGLTDLNGEFSARSEMSFGTFVLVNKAGYYGVRILDLSEAGIAPGKATIPLVLPRVVKPIALHALRVSLTLPVQGEWLGYDLKIADWLPPHGKGKVADIRFRYRSEFKGFGDIDKEREIVRSIKARRGEVFSEEEFKKAAGHWQGEMEVSFPGAKEGLIEGYWHYNELKLPHDAPETGYEPGKRYTAQTMGYRQPDRLVGYYLRTRVSLDAKGNIVSANYTKIYEDIRFDARFGTVSFCYYFNPTANDRNLEFDPKRNLFPREMPNANVANP